MSEGFNTEKIAEIANKLGELLAKETAENHLTPYAVTSVLVTLIFEVVMAIVDQRVEERLAEALGKSEEGKPKENIYQ